VQFCLIDTLLCLLQVTIIVFSVRKNVIGLKTPCYINSMGFNLVQKSYRFIAFIQGMYWGECKNVIGRLFLQ